MEPSCIESVLFVSRTSTARSCCKASRREFPVPVQNKPLLSWHSPGRTWFYRVNLPWVFSGAPDNCRRSRENTMATRSSSNEKKPSAKRIERQPTVVISNDEKGSTSCREHLTTPRSPRSLPQYMAWLRTSAVKQASLPFRVLQGQKARPKLPSRVVQDFAKPLLPLTRLSSKRDYESSMLHRRWLTLLSFCRIYSSILVDRDVASRRNKEIQVALACLAVWQCLPPVVPVMPGMLGGEIMEHPFKIVVPPPS